MIDFNAYLDEDEKEKDKGIGTDYNDYLDNAQPQKKPSQVAAQEQKPVEPEKKKGFMDKVGDFFGGVKKKGEQVVKDVRTFGEAVVEHPEWVAQEVSTSPGRFKEFAVGKDKSKNVDETKVQDELINSIIVERDATAKRVEELERRSKVLPQGNFGYNKFINSVDNIEAERKTIEIAAKAYEKDNPGKKASDEPLYKELMAKNEEKMRIAAGDDPEVLLQQEKQTLEVYDQFLENTVADRGFFGQLVETIKDPLNVLPFIGDVVQGGGFIADYQVIKKYERGETLELDEQARLGRMRAETLKKYISSGMGTKVGDMVGHMPKYALEFWLTGSLYTAGKTGALKLTGKAGSQIIAKELLKESGEQAVKFTVKENAMRLVSGLIGSAVQTGVGFSPTIANKTAEYMIPEYDILVTPEGEAAFTKIDEGDSFTKALTKAGLVTYVEVATERSGFLVEDPMRMMKKAIIGKYITKMGITDAGTFSKVAKAIGWDGIVGEVFEEELAEIFQAPIEERDYYAPLMSPEGTERLWVETLGITAFGGMSKATSSGFDVAQNFGKNRRIEGDTIDISDLAEQEKKIGVTTKTDDGFKQYEVKQPITVYRAVDSTNKEATLGNGTYFAFEHDNASRYGQTVVEFTLPADIKLLDLTEPSALNTYQDEARDQNPEMFASMIEKMGADKAMAQLTTDYAKQQGYDGIIADDAVYGAVVFDQKNLLSHDEKVAVNEGWKPGDKAKFDEALMMKDAETVKNMIPTVPAYYQEKFAKEIVAVTMPSIMGEKPAVKVNEQPVDVSKGLPIPAETGKAQVLNPNTGKLQYNKAQGLLSDVNVYQQMNDSDPLKATLKAHIESTYKARLAEAFPEGIDVGKKVVTRTIEKRASEKAKKILESAKVKVPQEPKVQPKKERSSVSKQVPVTIGNAILPGLDIKVFKEAVDKATADNTLPKSIALPGGVIVNVPVGWSLSDLKGRWTQLIPKEVPGTKFDKLASEAGVPVTESPYADAVKVERIVKSQDPDTISKLVKYIEAVRQSKTLNEKEKEIRTDTVMDIVRKQYPELGAEGLQQFKDILTAPIKESTGNAEVTEPTPGIPAEALNLPATPGNAAYEGNLRSVNEVREQLGLEPVKPVQFPEIVKIARNLFDGALPKVKMPRAKAAIGVPLGYFVSGGPNAGQIVLNPEIFKDSALMERVLSHELGHATDYLEDKTMGRGNLLGRIASLRDFTRETFTDLETEARVDELTRRKFELQQLRREQTDEEGKVKNDKTSKREYAKLGKELTSVNKELQTIKDAAPFSQQVVFDELKAITQLWNPFMEKAPDTFTEVQKEMYARYVKYRLSGKELYADAISALYNMPDVLQKVAPTFYKGFFENLDQKPNVKANYFAIQHLLDFGQEAVDSDRQKTIRESFKKGEDLTRALREEKKNRDREYTFRLKYELIDKNQRVIDYVNQARKEGKPVAAEDNPQYWLEAHNYVGGIVKNYMEDYIQPLYTRIQENGMTWEDLGEALFLERVTMERGDIVNPTGMLAEIRPDLYEMVRGYLPPNIETRSTTDQLKKLKEVSNEVVTDGTTGATLWDEISTIFPKSIANPFGYTTETAKDSLANLEKQLGPGRWTVMQEVLQGFRKATNVITEMAEKEQFWKPELIKQIKANPAYATFQVLDYLQDYIPASIKHQQGTLKDIANPADATAMKSVSVIRAIERNKVKKKIVNFIRQNFPEEISEANYGWNGRARVALESRDKTKALFTTIEDGVTKGYYVDPYVAKTMEYSNVGENNAVMEVFHLFNSKAFRPMFITFNVGFQSFNLVRDFLRFYKNIPSMSLARAAKAYVQATPTAFRRAWNVPDQTIKDMENSKILGVTYNDVIKGATTEDKRIDVILARAGVTELKGHKMPAILKPLMAVLEVIEKTGNTIETLPKVAAYKELNGTMPDGDLAELIRTSVGSPDFLRKGAAYKVYNEVFLFSNAIKEGIRTDAAVATNPNTRAGWWIKTAKINIIPKIIMYAALMGLFGDGLKKMLEDVSEYDKTNYTIIPLGEDPNGKTIYIRLPSDETGRLIGGIFWKAMRAFHNEKTGLQDVMDLMSFTGGQLPTVNPLITAVSGVSQYLAGKNPYDYFRGRNVIPDAEFKAGGMYAFKPFANWLLQTVGLGTIFGGYVSEQAPDTKTWIQKVVETPVLSNIVGRWIKISDYGQTEKNRGVVQQEEQEAAKKLLEERKAIEKSVQEYNSGTRNITRKAEIELQLVKDIVGEGPYNGTRKAKVTNLRKKFNIAIIKKTADADVLSLIYANTNAEKMALLKTLRADMTDDEYQKLKVMVVQEGIVSKEVFKELEKRQ